VLLWHICTDSCMWICPKSDFAQQPKVVIGLPCKILSPLKDKTKGQKRDGYEKSADEEGVHVTACETSQRGLPSGACPSDSQQPCALHPHSYDMRAPGGPEAPLCSTSAPCGCRCNSVQGPSQHSGRALNNHPLLCSTMTLG
jgi:hypothetical protein